MTSSSRRATASGIAAPPPPRTRSDDRSWRPSCGFDRKSTSMVVIADQFVTPARSICRAAHSRSQRDSSTRVAAVCTGAFMQACMNAPVHTAATLVLLSRWDRECAALQIERAGVTNWSAITTMLVDFLSNPQLERYDLSSLRVLGGGGAAMPEAVARRLEEVIGLPYVEGYGLSETMAPTHINPPHRPKRQCGGIPIFN